MATLILTSIFFSVSYFVAPTLLVSWIENGFFYGTIRSHPKAEIFIVPVICLIYAVAFVVALGIASVGAAVCTLVPERVQELTDDDPELGKEIDLAATEVADDIMCLRYYILCGALLFFRQSLNHVCVVNVADELLGIDHRP